jgi:hypothetical protein
LTATVYHAFMPAATSLAEAEVEVE